MESKRPTSLPQSVQWPRSATEIGSCADIRNSARPATAISSRSAKLALCVDATHQSRKEPELTGRPRVPAPEAKDRPIPERRVPQVAAELALHPWAEAIRK